MRALVTAVFPGPEIARQIGSSDDATSCQIESSRAVRPEAAKEHQWCCQYVKVDPDEGDYAEKEGSMRIRGRLGYPLHRPRLEGRL